MNMASYAGGEHTAELIATDGAGNSAKQSWTLNMDPQGKIAAGEAAATLEAAESTSESTVVAPTSEVVPQEEREEGNDPAVVKEGSVLISTGAPTKVEYSTTPSEGVAVSAPEGPIQITPVGASAGEQSTNVVNGSVSVTSNIQTQVDTIVRPIFDGVMNFQAIRAITAPESYSWQVELGSGQYLEQVSEQNAVQLYYEDGTPAMLISAEQAHDATGAVVPTTLEKTGPDEITLHVKHKGSSYVYPIMAGPSFEVGYQATVITQPIIEGPPHEEGPTAEEILNNQWSIIANVSAPQAAGCPGEGEACASSSGYIKTYGFIECIQLPLIGCANAYEQKIRGFFYFNFNEAWMSKRQPNCEPSGSATIIVEDEYCKWVGPDHQKYGAGYHITSQVKFRLVSQPKAVAGNWKYITVRMFGSGNAYAHQTSAICNPSRPEC
jgi:hypothetical protein